jgi:phage N-6-adenine-methyltransferase
MPTQPSESTEQGSTTHATPPEIVRAYILPAATDDWATPQALFDALHTTYDFNLDPCASHANHKCARYFTEAENGLLQDWGAARVFCNPPYGRGIADWMAKADEASRRGAIVVMLLPARTDTKWFHRFALQHEVTFLEGRLKFGDAKHAAPFGSMLVVFRPVVATQRRRTGRHWGRRAARVLLPRFALRGRVAAPSRTMRRHDGDTRIGRQ